MIRYTVVQPSWVDEQLAQLWLTAPDRAAVTAASDTAYQELGEDAEAKGELVEGNLRKLISGPLWFYYTVHPDDRLVKVWSIRPAK